MEAKGILPLTGKYLRCVAMPLGGIGTGSIALGGDGLLKQWQITNTVNHRAFVPYSFFAAWIHKVGNSEEVPFCRALISSKAHADRDFKPAESVRDHLIGTAIKKMFNNLPGIEEIQYNGEYPVTFLTFKDSSLPMDVRLIAFNPFIPLDSKNSGLPLIIFQFHLENTSKFSYEITIAGNLLNFLGWDGMKIIVENIDPLFGGNINVHKRVGNWNAINMKSKILLKTDKRYGDLTFAIDQSDTMITTQWSDLQNVWSKFSRDGTLPEAESNEMSSIGQTWVGSLASKKILAPGEKAVITFVLSWNFPNRIVDWRLNKTLIPDTNTEYWIGNRYNEWFDNSLGVIEYLQEHWEYLYNKTASFHEAFYSSTIPPEVLISISAPISTIRSPTCFWMRDGSFHGFEGCHGASTGKLYGGCCPLDCTHVWNYEFSLAYLFPSLERTMRETEFKIQNELGFLPHRAVIPLYLPQISLIPDPRDVPPAIDGMFGAVLKIFRDFQITGDREFLLKSWPFIDRLMEFVFKSYDCDKKGVIYLYQPNTYDCSIIGINSFIGSLYLSALLACEEICKELNLQDRSKKFRALFNTGKLMLDSECWNGEYYIQKYDESLIKEFQYGIGCHSDQLIGQWWSFNLGFSYILPPEHVNKALDSIFKNNFKESLEGIEQSPRIFASSSDSGLMNCTWPHGNKPVVPTKYSDEVWTGIEYEVAALCIFMGKIPEALKIIRSVRSRYDGSRRNPWNEVECGDHYVRPMSSWTLLRAFTGVIYLAGSKKFAIAPKVNKTNFQTFFITGTAWGQAKQEFSKRKFILRIRVVHGKLDIKSISIGVLDGFKPRKCRSYIIISQEDQKTFVEGNLENLTSKFELEFSLLNTIILNEGQEFVLELD